MNELCRLQNGGNENRMQKKCVSRDLIVVLKILNHSNKISPAKLVEMIKETVTHGYIMKI